MYQKIVSYNLEPEELDNDFADFYQNRKRDSFFAGVFRDKDKIIAIRDHLGIIPLYYRRIGREWKFSFYQSDLLISQDKVDQGAIRLAISLGTMRFKPLIQDIKIVPAGSVMQFYSNKVELKYQYTITPVDLNNKSFNIIELFDNLLTDVVHRQASKIKSIGIFLSGGTDSALLAYYLNKTNKNINCFTAAGWELNTPEIINAQRQSSYLKIAKHEVIQISGNEMDPNDLIKLYKDPHLTSPSLAQVQLWQANQMSQLDAIAFAQGSDTLACSVHSQNNIWFMMMFPLWMRKYIFGDKYSSNLTHNFLTYMHTGMLNRGEFQSNLSDWKYHKLTNIQQLILLGMLYGHTPSDSELFVLPTLNNNQMIINPFYNMDLIEKSLSLPIWTRLSLDLTKDTKLYIDKKIIKKLAEKNLTRTKNVSKKGYTINVNNDVLDKIGNKKWYPHKWHYEYKVRLCLMNQWLIRKGYQPYIWK